MASALISCEAALVPRQLIEAERRSKGSRDLLFGNGLSHLRPSNSNGGWFNGAVARSRAIDPTFPELSPHDLRHTAASLAISAGANVKAVQRMLGHASAAMTLSRLSLLARSNYGGVVAYTEHGRSFNANRLMLGYRQLIDYFQTRRPDLAIPESSWPL